MTKVSLFKTKFIPSEIQLDFRLYGKYASFLRRHPTHAIRCLWGIVVPPHESSMIETAWTGYRTNIFTCSRGTSKSFTIGSLFAPTKALLFKNSSILIASASRFRGGKLVLKDSSRLLSGSLKDQKPGNRWGITSLLHKPTLIKKDPDMWYQEFTSNSMVFTIPTNNEESVRGIRAGILVLDERNTFDGDLIQNVYMPFLNVGSSFENPAEGSEGNQVFQVGTIDYTYRDWYKEILSAQDLSKIQYELQTAIREQNWSLYDKLREQYGNRLKNSSVAVIRYDYTDLLIPTEIGKYKVKYPGAIEGKHIRFDDRDNCSYIYTYPINKKQLEEPLDEGIADKETWNAEQRNLFIKADGNVFPYELIEQATGPIFTQTEEKRRGWDSDAEGRHYLPPVLYESSDPCVLGVDTARIQDFSAFVVIRIGDISDHYFKVVRDEYSLKDHAGPSPWSNVIWAEQQQQMTAKEIADRIRELRSRYNIVALRHCPGIVMDYRGGGVHVRDELVNPSAPIDKVSGLPVEGWNPPQKIFDPDDRDERLGKELLVDSSAWFGLRLLNTNDTINHELVGFIKAQLQANKLFIGSSKSRKSFKDPDNKMYPGWVGADILKHQLLRIQGVLTAAGRSIRYEMPGDPNKNENKKDMLFAFLYAGHALREWVTTQMRVRKNVPIGYGEVFRVGPQMY